MSKTAPADATTAPLPMSREEMDALGWDALDILLVHEDIAGEYLPLIAAEWSKADVEILIENEISLRRRTQTRTEDQIDLVKCTECNTGIAADSKFCPNCGAKLS